MNIDRYKYRYWCDRLNNMLKVTDIEYYDDLCGEGLEIHALVHHHDCHYNEAYNISTGNELKKLMQCTGMRDKNGKLIYEGDIIKGVDVFNSLDYASIVYRPDFGDYVLRKLNYPNDMDLTCLKEKEVIGHIFDGKDWSNK